MDVFKYAHALTSVAPSPHPPPPGRRPLQHSRYRPDHKPPWMDMRETHIMRGTSAIPADIQSTVPTPESACAADVDGRELGESAVQ